MVSTGAALRRLAALLPVLCAFAVWHPLRNSYFVGDDFQHLYDLVTKSLPRLLGQFWGGHLYTVRNAVLLGLYETFGPDPRGWFWTVLLTHLLNTALLYLVVRRFSGDRWVACATAILWGTCPVLEGALGWLSVYGQVLLATISLAVLASLGRLLETGASLSPRLAVIWAVAFGLGITCFGMGLGLAAAFPIAVALILPRQHLPRRSLAVLALGAVITLAAYALLRAYSPESPAAERVLFSAGATLRSSPAALVLTGHLIGFGTTTLLLGFLGLDRGYPDAVAGATVAVTATAVVAALWSSDGSLRRRLLALALLALAAYGTIALGRAGLVTGLKMALGAAATQTRYHYLPLALLAAVFATALAGLASRGPAARRIVHAGAALWTAARLVLLASSPLAIQHAPKERAAAAAFVERVRDTVAATPPGQVALIENRPFGPMLGLPVGRLGSLGAFVVFFPSDVVDGRTVRFAVDAREYLRAHEEGGRVAGLVVPRWADTSTRCGRRVIARPPMDEEARAQALLEFVRRNFPTPSGGKITLDTALLSEQIVDSMGITLLAAFVEEQFGVAFDGTELRKGRLETVRAVAALLDRLA